MKVSQIARQRGLCRRRIDKWIWLDGAAGKKPDAAALRDGGIFPRLLTSTLGGGLSAWAHAVRGDSETWLCRLLLGTRKAAVAVAPAESRGWKDYLCTIRRDAT